MTQSAPAPALPTDVFVTGARGFIGRTLAAHLRAQGVRVAGVDIAADEATGVVAGDVTDPAPWQHAIAPGAVVVHTAALVSNVPTLAEAWRVNTLGTRRVLDAAIAAGARRFVYVSSVRAFSDLGFPDGVTEDHPLRPDGNPYVDTRIAAEQAVLQAHAAGEAEVVVVRPGDVYGPGSRPWTVLPVEMMRARRFVLPDGGRGIFSPVYVDDLVRGLELVAAHPAAAGRVFTLSGGVGVTNREFFGHYSRMLGQRGPVCVPTPVALALATAADRAARLAGGETEANPTAVRYFLRRGTYSIERARRLLGYEPQVDLAEGMTRTEAWLRAEGLL
ncbi:NAD(P)-dependent oxidoreductase [Nocardioides sp. TRM66260-LWL]|uniref:NAD-dependent epimerase/dehydratase family protein n=1 Tax=Nocardioides sp. TRM66260-LWL TaxID=2874478 RepID=UPI001CC664D6|nr:NAD(P)-dependent oxidoreductase [Nocardioides sp. TRM66260-LWL]MBZ5734686.1 NAD(P)-dependent oxidoreductase [Nocardioides sp. TRM66260-LWL]